MTNSTKLIANLAVAIGLIGSLAVSAATPSLARTHTEKFAAITADDAYRDNLTEALPVLEKHEAPVAIYVAPSLINGSSGLAGKRWTAGGARFHAARVARFDAMADALEAHLDLDRLAEIIATTDDTDDMNHMEVTAR